MTPDYVVVCTSSYAIPTLKQVWVFAATMHELMSNDHSWGTLERYLAMCRRKMLWNVGGSFGRRRTTSRELVRTLGRKQYQGAR